MDICMMVYYAITENYKVIVTQIAHRRVKDVHFRLSRRLKNSLNISGLTNERAILKSSERRFKTSVLKTCGTKIQLDGYRTPRPPPLLM